MIHVTICHVMATSSSDDKIEICYLMQMKVWTSYMYPNKNQHKSVKCGERDPLLNVHVHV